MNSPVTVSTASQWYYASGKVRSGPVPFSELQQLAATGGLQASDMVLMKGTAQWQQAGTVEELFPVVEALAAYQVQPPVGSSLRSLAARVTEKQQWPLVAGVAAIVLLLAVVMVSVLSDGGKSQPSNQDIQQVVTGPHVQPVQKSGPKPKADPKPEPEPEPKPEPKPAGPSHPADIQPAANVDEREFLIYAYQKLRNAVPYAVHDRGNVRQHLDQLRNRVNRYHEYIVDRKIDAKVQSLYRDLLSSIDIFDDYLVQLDRIDRGILARTERDAADTGYKAGFAGSYTAASAYDQGATGGDAALVGIAAAAVTLVFEDLKKRQALDEAKRQALESASGELKRGMSVISARDTNTLSDFAAKYRWKRDQNGRPVDAFTQIETDLSNQYLNASSAEEALQASKAIVEAARLVPVGAIYDEHRAHALHWAARSATWAAEQELEGKKWGSVKSPSVHNAIKLWDAALRYDSADEHGTLRSQKAWALAIAGRFDDEIREANKVFEIQKRRPGFAYNYACLCSCTGDPANVAIRHLKLALAQDIIFNSDSFKPISVQRAKRDPNLEDLRKQRPKAFADVVDVRCKWRIEWGPFLGDDICLVNKSPFPLTNVAFDVSVKSTGYADWGPYRFKAARIGPGETFKWNTKIASRGKDAEENAILHCDQDK